MHELASGYDFPTGIFDRRGERIADAKADPEVVLAEVDLAERTAVAVARQLAGARRPRGAVAHEGPLTTLAKEVP